MSYFRNLATKINMALRAPASSAVKSPVTGSMYNVMVRGYSLAETMHQ
eukprot:gene8179-9622_t